MEEIISRYLKTNDAFYMLKFHPLICTLKENSEITHSYFHSNAIETIVEVLNTDNSEVPSKNPKYIA
jgi:hypothetical protein